MSVAVTIPVWNQRPELLDAAVRSAMRAGADQIVVVDDGSGTPVRNEWGVPVEVHRIEHGGVPAAFNEALSRVHCEYVARFASDDEMDKDKLRLQREFMEALHADASFHDCRDSRTGEKYDTGMPQPRAWPGASRDKWRARLRTANRFYGCTSMIRTEVLRGYRHPLELLWSHDWYMHNWVEHRAGWHYLPEVLSTIGRYDTGLEAMGRGNPTAARCQAQAAEMIREQWGAA